MAFSLFDHPHFSALLKHQGIADLFDSEAELSSMLRFESALAEAEAALGVIPKEAAVAIVNSIQAFQPPIDVLIEGARRDGLIVPALIKSLRDEVPEPVANMFILAPPVRTPSTPVSSSACNRPSPF